MIVHDDGFCPYCNIGISGQEWRMKFCQNCKLDFSEEEIQEDPEEEEEEEDDEI